MFTSFHVSCRFAFKRRFISRTRYDFRVSSYITAWISSRPFTILVVRWDGNVRRLRVYDASRFAGLCVTGIVYRRVDYISNILQGIATYSDRIRGVFLHDTLRTRFRLDALQPFRDTRNAFIDRFFPCGRAIICRRSAIANRWSCLFKESSLGSAIRVSDIVLSNRLSASATRTTFRFQYRFFRILYQGMDEIKVRFYRGL